jgi:hypothetical protein
MDLLILAVLFGCGVVGLVYAAKAGVAMYEKFHVQ